VLLRIAENNERQTTVLDIRIDKLRVHIEDHLSIEVVRIGLGELSKGINGHAAAGLQDHPILSCSPHEIQLIDSVKYM
jgi:hypothetical protein